MSEPVFIPSTALVRQIVAGSVQVNVANYSLESLDSLCVKLKAGSKGIHVLRLHAQGRSVTARGRPSNETNQGMGVGCDPFGHESHVAAVDHASWLAQHASQRKKVQDVLLDILSHAPITELHIGMRLLSSGYKAVSVGLQRSKTLRKLSFAGSRMGDAKVGLLLEGIIGCQSLKVLDLSSCDLGQEAVHTISVAIKEHMQQRVRMLFAATLRVHLDSSLPPNLARQLYETDLSNAQHAVEARCGGIKILYLPYNPKITDNVALSLRDALSMESSLQLLNLQGCGLSLAVEKEFVDLMKEHVSLVRVDLRHGSGRKGHRLGLIRLRSPKAFHQGHKEQHAVRDHSKEQENVPLQVRHHEELVRDHSKQEENVPWQEQHEEQQAVREQSMEEENGHLQVWHEEEQAVQEQSMEEENVRLQVLLKVVPERMEARDQDVLARMAHKCTQTGSKTGTGAKKRGWRARRGRQKACQKRASKRGRLSGRKQSGKTKRLRTEGPGMLLQGQQLQEAADRSQYTSQSTQGYKKLEEGCAVSRWGDSLWGEDLEGQQQQGFGAQGSRHGQQQEEAQRQKEEGALTEVIDLLRHLELAVSKKEYTWALRSHPGALDDTQPMLCLVPASSHQDPNGGRDRGRSGMHSIHLEQEPQPQQGAVFESLLPASSNPNPRGSRDRGRSGIHSIHLEQQSLPPAKHSISERWMRAL